MLKRRLILLIIILAAILFMKYMDKIAAKYGNGVLNYYSEILYGTHLTKINHTYITFDKNWKYESFIAPNKSFIISNKDTFEISKICGYGIHNRKLYFLVRTKNNDKIYFSFDNQKSVYEFEPEIIKFRNSGVQIRNWIDLENKTFIIKNWKLIFIFVCYLLIPFLIVFVLIDILKSYRGVR
jgi:hypothetical protein